VNGIGERCGNARLEEVLVGLRLKGGVDRYDLTEIPALSQMVAEYTNIPIPVTKPIVGEHAFAHESGIHIAAMLENPSTYEYVEPALLGCQRKFLLGKHTGRKALIHILSTHGYSIPDEKIDIILDYIKQHSEGKGAVTPEFLDACIQKVVQRN
jgi:methanogen homocitrate synthase